MPFKTIIKKNIFFLAVFFCFSFLIGFTISNRGTALANEEETASDCELLEGDNKEKCLKLEEKENAYKKIIELKQKQQSSLDKQISLMQSEMVSLEAEIKANENKIVELDGQISVIDGRIREKERLINRQKKLLSGLVQLYYENNGRNIFSSFSGNVMVSAFLSEEDQISQVGQKVREVLSSIKALKTGLENEKGDIEKKKSETFELKKDKENKNKELENSKTRKTALLTETQGEEAKYQKKLERIEQQKQDLLGDIDELYATNSAEIEALKASLPKPDAKYAASTSWFYSQKDPRWGNKTIGQSKTLIKDYGCAISTVAMVFTFHGEKITPKELAKQPIYYWDLISWPATWGSVNLKTNTKHGGVNWDTIDEEIGNSNPVIVFIRAKGRAGHYVVIHNKDSEGKYVVHDPYFGSNIFLDSSIKLLAKMYDSKVSKSSVDQMVLYQ